LFSPLIHHFKKVNILQEIKKKQIFKKCYQRQLKLSIIYSILFCNLSFEKVSIFQEKEEDIQKLLQATT